MEPPKPTVKRAFAIIRALGLMASRRDGEWRINLPGGAGATAYYTDDALDAVKTARDMARRASA
jgi:hypothetical protein